MKIYYLTTSLTSEQFEKLLKHARIKPNPSNQNFHHALITAIAHYELVEVVSITPINSDTLDVMEIKDSDDYENMVHYHIVGFQNKNKHKTVKKNLYHYLQNNLKNDDIIITDSMNLTLSRIANKVAKKHNNIVIGVLTDNPKFITNLPKLISALMIKEMKKYDGYIALTPSLLSLSKGTNKPHIIIEGIYENINHSMRKNNLDYLFFAGSLNKKYGINNLIKAFSLLDCPYQLLIAGHGKLDEESSKIINEDRSIKLLGTLSKKEILTYENNAIININPRPYIENLDDYSIPSKVIEYSGSGRPTLSSHHKRLEEIYGDKIFWCNSNTSIEIYNALVNILKNIKTAEKKAISAQKITQKTFGVSVVGEKISNFLKAFNNK